MTLTFEVKVKKSRSKVILVLSLGCLQFTRYSDDLCAGFLPVPTDQNQCLSMTSCIVFINYFINYFSHMTFVQGHNALYGHIVHIYRTNHNTDVKLSLMNRCEFYLSFEFKSLDLDL